METTALYLHRRPSGNEVELEVYAQGVMKSFFEDYHLDMIHDMLWTMLKSTFTIEDSTLGLEDSRDMIYFYERVHELMLAGSLLYKDEEG
ncbi:hypothetical protein [Pedobacter duraquae]|uniref:Uncharacterized protein n=1 Tax=Pedobacter duraquae TaxID=425511 RepID=A0A4R6IF28_9SPHI|nr:hypothetical protein [Pedobacter duraquae]TDO20321.1 hypothetical protein CLV32_4081 [Pedobacter duraquae]